MAVEPRAALDRLVAALEAHFDAIANRRSDADPRVDDTYEILADAFDVYDEALARVYDEVTPFMLVDDDHDDHDDADALDDDDEGELFDDDVDDDDVDGIDHADEAELIVVDGN
jgi:hypothetical protein